MNSTRSSLWSALPCAVACLSASCASTPPKSAFDTGRNPATNFELEGAPFCFVGSNNYYLAYKPPVMVDDVLESARALGIKVIRIWGFIDRGSLDGRVRDVDEGAAQRGVYFQAWDAVRQRTVFNDGPDGLQRLDYALAKAGELGLKVVVVLTNNWRDFGGMDQYLEWYGLTTHSAFYEDERVRATYKAWLWHLAMRVNGLTQRTYRDDPTIFAWELGNEPRASVGTSNHVLTRWADELSSYLKSIDANHLLAVGDEGFLDGPSEHWTYHADYGVDHRALTALPGVDYGTFHMYPEAWGAGFGWGERWIDDHLSVARELRKPTVLEEYGLRVTRDRLGRVTDGLPTRLAAYRAWNERILAHGGNAAMFWLLVGRDTEQGGSYPDYDQFSVYRGDATASLLSEYAQQFSAHAPACSGEPNRSPAPSPFVRVRQSRLSAFGWRADDG